MLSYEASHRKNSPATLGVGKYQIQCWSWFWDGVGFGHGWLGGASLGGAPRVGGVFFLGWGWFGRGIGLG